MAVCATLSGLNLDCRDSVGGIETLYILPAETSISFNATDGAVALTGITVDDGSVTLAGMSEYELTRETGDIAEAGTYSYENGTVFYTQTLNAIFNKITGAKLDELYQVAKNRKLCVIALDNNGRYWLIGNSHGAFASGHAAQTGTAFGDRNGVTLTITGITKEPMVEVTVV